MTKRSLNILQLYPQEMNIYGDWGNTLTLKKRAEWHGYDVNLMRHDDGDAFPKDVDMIVGGGGQDSGQDKIKDDLIGIGDNLHRLADDGTPMLVICGMYQLFGHFFETQTGHRIPGIGILDVTTIATSERLIGNIITESAEFGKIIGYENHSGQTHLANDDAAFGRVIKGAGNNSQGKTEGARYKNVIGTYMHGSLLPKNPRVADFMIGVAAANKYGDFTPSALDESIINAARNSASSRPR